MSRALVLVGGGHAHIQVIKDLRAPADTRPVLISDGEEAVYSGMLPAVVARLRPLDDALVHLRALCERHSWQFIDGRVTAVDAQKRVLEVKQRDIEKKLAVRYDVLSLDVGSTVRRIPGDWDERGAQQLPMVLATRPIAQLDASVAAFERAARADGGGTRRVLVLGDGAAGFELACALQARLGASLRGVSEFKIALCGRRGKLAQQFGAALSRAAQSALKSRGVTTLATNDVVRVERGKVHFADGGSLPFDLLLLATGAAAHGWLASDTSFEVDKRGFVRVHDTLQTVGHGYVFAAGDCASFGDDAFPPKAGVYAVRMGPVLTHNIGEVLRGEAARKLRRFAPQKEFLTLLSLGDGTAIGSKYGVAFGGTWVYRLKSHIDEQWQSMFKTAGADFPKTKADGTVFEGDAAEGAAALIGAGDTASCDAFESQLAVLRRMDVDVAFRERLVHVVAERAVR